MKGSDYDTDREWHLRNMKYLARDGLMIPLDATTKQQSLQVQNLKMIELGCVIAQAFCSQKPFREITLNALNYPK